MRADVKTRDEHYKTHFYMAGLSINDIRELEDLNPIEGGDEYYVQRNLIPLSRVDEVIDKEVGDGSAIPGTGDEQPNPGNVRAAFGMILQNRIQHVLDVEADRIRQNKSMDRFYSKFEANVREQIASIVKAVCVGSGRAVSAQTVARAYAMEHCATSQRDFDSGDVTQWQNGTRAANAAEGILNLIYEDAEPCPNTAA